MKIIKNNYKLIQGDCLVELEKIEDKTIGLVVIDPPYNIGKAEWDRIDSYIEWLGGVFKELDRVLKDNGSFYFFHNDFLQIVELQNYINKHTEFKFKQLIVWNKKFKGSRTEGFFQGFNEVEGLRNYQKMAEYCLFYTKVNDLGITTKDISKNNHPTLRRYFKDMMDYIGLAKKDIISIMGQRADHTFRWRSSQWDKPTKELYKDLEEEFNLKKWKMYKPYSWVEEKFWEERYVFNNQRTHHSVWNYEIAEKQGHITPKPVPLLENIIKHSSNEGDVVLDCFMGSGSTGVACKKLNRKFIGIELSEEYFEIAKKRIGV